jgi:hypothetical protein
MNPTHAAALLRSMPGLASRRGIIAGLASGLVATGIVVANVDEAEARKKRKRNRKRKNKKDRKGNNPPTTRADATCSGPPDFGLSNPEGNIRFAQTFTALATGPLVSAELQLNKREGSTGDYILRLSPVDGAGIPTDEVLAETSVANADVPAGGPIVTFTFADPFSVKAGADYALVMTRTEGDVGWFALGNNSCSGRAFQSNSQAGPFFESSDSDDFIFTTFVTS